MNKYHMGLNFIIFVFYIMGIIFWNTWDRDLGVLLILMAIYIKQPFLGE